MDCSLPGSSVYGVFQARILEWVAMPSSRGSSWPRNWTHVSYVSCIGRWALSHYCHLGSPITWVGIIKSIEGLKRKTEVWWEEFCLHSAFGLKTATSMPARISISDLPAAPIIMWDCSLKYLFLSLSPNIYIYDIYIYSSSSYWFYFSEDP